MRLGGRLAAAIEIMADIETRRRPATDALKDWGLSHRFAGSGDRAAIGNIVHDALRMKLSHGFLMDSDTPHALAHAVLLRQWAMTPDGLAGALADDPFAPEAISSDILSACLARDLAAAPAHVRADVPEWAAPMLQATFGDGWENEAAALAGRPPLDLRVNTLKADRARVGKALARTGAHETAIARHGLRIDAAEGPARQPNVTADLGYRKGWFEVQDEGSQIVSDLIMAEPGEQVLDYCAGGGGKTLALSAVMDNKGQVHAYDADRKRLAPIVERLRRAGTRNVQTHDDRKTLTALQGRMDRVVVDAPCTGSGTWRRRPDSKWRLTEKSLGERIAEQDAALAAASAYVRPGGEFVYITCSLFAGENESRMHDFRAAHRDFKPVPLTERWQRLYGDGAPRPHVASDGSLTLSPAATGTDGFFIAVMRRNG